MSKFSQDLFTKICDEITTSSVGLTHICKKHGIIKGTFLRWLRDDESGELRNQYTRAKEEQADFFVEQILEIADDSTNDTTIVEKNGETYEQENKEWVNRSRLRIDSRKWIASKLLPKKYGDKIDVTTDGEKIKSIPVVLPNGKTMDDLFKEMRPEEEE